MGTDERTDRRTEEIMGQLPELTKYYCNKRDNRIYSDNYGIDGVL